MGFGRAFFVGMIGVCVMVGSVVGGCGTEVWAYDHMVQIVPEQESLEEEIGGSRGDDIGMADTGTSDVKTGEKKTGEVEVSGETAVSSEAISAQEMAEIVSEAEKDVGVGELFALSAVLMDGDSGRVLFEKDGETPRPNASTTKVMTCILALEHGAGDDYVEVSARAASQPDVQLNMREGEQYYLEDLLYSLMLQSHNDTAVAIAEHIGGSVENFAKMMNEKAAEIGCTDTYFITPNGLDAQDSSGTHHTTARDLALIMRYAIKSEMFLKITETKERSFSDLSGKRRFTVHNTNALLDMTDGVLSGKTGFTGDAGYCYVCACKKQDKTFIVALLGCGWPNNKTYKWKDTLRLLNYGDQNYQYQTYWKEPELPALLVKGGAEEGASFGEEAFIQPQLSATDQDKKKKLLLHTDEKITATLTLNKDLTAPIQKGARIGALTYTLNSTKLATYPITADRTISRKTYLWCADKVFHEFFH